MLPTNLDAIRKLDLFSPKITQFMNFNKGKTKSLAGGFLTIFVWLLFLIYTWVQFSSLLNGDVKMISSLAKTMAYSDQQFQWNMKDSATIFLQIVEFPWKSLPFDNDLKRFIKIEFAMRLGVPDKKGKYSNGSYKEPKKYGAKKCEFNDPGINMADPSIYICPDFGDDEIYL